MSSWIALMKEAIAAAPTVEHGVKVLLQFIHNEMHHGSGQTNPTGVVNEALEAADEIAEAVAAPATAPAEPEQEVKTTDYGSSTSSSTVA